VKSITNSVPLWFSIAMLTDMPCAVCSSIWSWICICGGVAGLSAAMRAFFALGLIGRRRLRPRGEAATAARRMAGPADPFALGDGPDACLLLHGLTGSPAEMRPVGEALAAAGFRALGPLLPGHGTTPEDLVVTTRDDLVQAAESALLSLQGARRLFLCGLSVRRLL